MNKSGEFEVSFTPILNVDVKQFKKRYYSATRYFLGANIFCIYDNGHLIVSSPTGKVYLNCDTWYATIKLLCEMEQSVRVFISIKDEARGVECCYESELPKF